MLFFALFLIFALFHLSNQFKQIFKDQILDFDKNLNIFYQNVCIVALRVAWPIVVGAECVGEQLGFFLTFFGSLGCTLSGINVTLIQYCIWAHLKEQCSSQYLWYDVVLIVQFNFAQCFAFFPMLPH